jgi:cytochrome c-type biogenesis protein CcmI
MLVFFAMVILLLVMVLTFIVRPLMWPSAAVKVDDGAEKREIFRQQFDEIEQDKIIGMLDTDQYNIAKTELERRMLDELGSTEKIAAVAKPDVRLAFILIIIIPILAIFIYLAIGRPMAMISAADMPAVAQEATMPVAPEASPASAANIRGTISLAPALASNIDPATTVFIFARATQGAPMPLAIVRTTVKELPYTYQLDDSTTLMSDLKLSQASEVVVVARISKGGDAKAKAGDLQGISVAVKPNGVTVDIEINQVLR